MQWLVWMVMLVACGSKSASTREQRAAQIENDFRAKHFVVEVSARGDALVIKKLQVEGRNGCAASTVPLLLVFSERRQQGAITIFPVIDQQQLIADGFRRIECEDGKGAVFGEALPFDTAQAVARGFGGEADKIERSRKLVRQIAEEAYPMWSSANPSKGCPERIGDLTNAEDEVVDAWDQPIIMYCGASLPPGAKGLAILSVGPDGQAGTADDIRSWDEK